MLTTVNDYYPNWLIFLVNLCIIDLKHKRLKKMNTLRNSVRLVGNLGMDPDVKEFEGNKKKARLSLATKDSYRNDKGELVTDTQWHNLVLWGAQAKFAEEDLKKGDE